MNIISTSILPTDLSRLLTETAIPAIYRVATYFTLTMLDDPAMLALAFC